MKKLAVITGGTKGIGRSLVFKFAENGFDIATCSRSKDDLKQLKAEVESDTDAEVFIKKIDVSEKSEIDVFIDFILSLEENVDVLINNAGIFTPGQIHLEDEGVLENTIQTNLYSAYYLTRGLINGMMERKEGYIFNLCSTASFMPYINGGSYCISKFALLGMTKVLREEMKEHDVKVTAVMPGATFTASWEGVDIPKSRFMKPDDVAEAMWTCYQLSDRTVVEELVLRPQLGDI